MKKSGPTADPADLDDIIRAIVHRIYTKFPTSFTPVELGTILEYLGQSPETAYYVSGRNGDFRDILFLVNRDAEMFYKFKVAGLLSDMEFEAGCPEYVKEMISIALLPLETYWVIRDQRPPAPKLQNILEALRVHSVVEGFRRAAGAQR
jgi:hypothetical protein